MAPAPRASNPARPTSRPAPAAGRAPGSIATPPCAPRASPAWPARPVAPSSPTSPATASSRPSAAAPTAAPGATTCPAPKPTAAGAGAAADRLAPGHWAADLRLVRVYGQAVLTLHDRHSRRLLAVRPPSKAAGPIAQALIRLLAPLPPAWRQTVTFDNGPQFARHYQLHARGIQTCFCDPHAPWQKGGIENAIGRLRRTLPRKADLATLSAARFTQLVQAYKQHPAPMPRLPNASRDLLGSSVALEM